MHAAKIGNKSEIAKLLREKISEAVKDTSDVFIYDRLSAYAQLTSCLLSRACAIGNFE